MEGEPGCGSPTSSLPGQAEVLTLAVLLHDCSSDAHSGFHAQGRRQLPAVAGLWVPSALTSVLSLPPSLPYHYVLLSYILECASTLTEYQSPAEQRHLPLPTKNKFI